VMLVSALGFLATLLGASIREYAVLAVICVMLLQIFAGLVVMRLPRAFPEAKNAEFRLGPIGRVVFGGTTILSSIAFLVLGVVDSPRNGIACLVVLGLGVVYYYARRAVLARQGRSLDDALQSGHSAEG